MVSALASWQPWINHFYFHPCTVRRPPRRMIAQLYFLPFSLFSSFFFGDRNGKCKTRKGNAPSGGGGGGLHQLSNRRWPWDWGGGEGQTCSYICRRNWNFKATPKAPGKTRYGLLFNMSVSRKGKLPLWGILGLREPYLITDMLSSPHWTFFVWSRRFRDCIKVTVPAPDVRARLERRGENQEAADRPKRKSVWPPDGDGVSWGKTLKEIKDGGTGNERVKLCRKTSC